MKIGILTFHNAYNAGAVLQAYALQSFLTSLGHNVEIIDYRNKKITERYKLFSFKKAQKRNPIKVLKFLVVNLYRLRKYSLFYKDSIRYLNMSYRVNNFDDLLALNNDIIVVGSDQIWNRNITGFHDPFYWAEFSVSCNVKAITYAACMNTEILSSSEIERIKKSLLNFSAISVRETSLANFLTKIISCRIYTSLDPTLMIKRDFWIKLEKQAKRIIFSRYICVYAILDRENVINAARKLAEERNLELVIMEPIADVIPFDKKYKPSTLLGFITAIANAEYVVTSSFHGLAFSIIFHKEVYVYGDTGKNERMRSLLSNLGIDNHFITSNTLPNDRINYTSVEEKLNLLRKQSQQYLKDAVKTK